VDNQVAVDGNAMSQVGMLNHEWQVVLGILRKQPFEVVAPLIDKIISQCVQQAMQSTTQTYADHRTTE
jgi:hypothetical protein